MAKIRDVLGTKCDEDDAVTIRNALDEETLVCNENRELGLKDLELLEPAFDLLDDSDRLESMLAVLDETELDKLYSHHLLKDYDLLP